jgi:hypothetical protein
MTDKLPWWIDPLSYRLGEAVEVWKWHGDHVGALLIKMLAGNNPDRLRVSLAQLFATGKDGEFFHPARSEVANPRWTAPYAIQGKPAATIRKSHVVRIGDLAELTAPQLNQINGVALVLVAAANAFQNPTLLTTGKDEFDHFGDAASLPRLAFSRMAKRSISYPRGLRYKGAIIKTIQEFEAVLIDRSTWSSTP